MDGDPTPALTGRRRTRPTSLGCRNPWQPEPGRAPLIAAQAAVQTNRATSKGTHADALSGLKLARELGAWFHRTYAKQPGFKPGPFVPPPAPIDATIALKGEIAALRQRRSDTESAAEKAKLKQR